MKLRILSIMVLGSIASTSFCGNGLFTQAKGEKVKIASATTLEANFKKTNINVDGLQQMGIIGYFAEKEFYESDIEKSLDTLLEDFWKKTTDQIKQRMGEKKFEAEKEVQYKSFLAQVSELKPEVLKVLKQKPQEEKSEQ